jgi:hypothetical protein
MEGTAVAVRKGVPHSHVDLHPLDSVEVTGVCVPIRNSEVLLAAVYRSPGRAWSNADIIELLSFRHKSLLGGDLNAKHAIWHSEVSNPSGVKLFDLFHAHDIDISTPQCPTHYSPAGHGDVLDTVGQWSPTFLCLRAHLRLYESGGHQPIAEPIFIFSGQIKMDTK